MSSNVVTNTIAWIYNERKKNISVKLKNLSFLDFVYDVFKKKYTMSKIVVKRFKNFLFSLKKFKKRYPRINLFCLFIGLDIDEKKTIENELAKKYLDFML